VNANDMVRTLLDGFAESGRGLDVDEESSVGPAVGAAIGPMPLASPISIPLLAEGGGVADLSATLHRRRAQRIFGVDQVAPGLLLECVAAGLAADRRYWPADQGCCALRPVLVAQRVDGLPQAVYELDPDGRTATPVMELPTSADAEALTLQREFAAAAAVVAVLSDVDHAERRHGAHGYRRLMTRAGAAVYAMWLEAVAHGLVGSVFAGFLPAAVRLPLRCDGVSRHQLFAVALGSPAPGPAPGPSGAA
jgi:Nitroreductase family